MQSDNIYVEYLSPLAERSALSMQWVHTLQMAWDIRQSVCALGESKSGWIDYAQDWRKRHGKEGREERDADGQHRASWGGKEKGIA
eukprot:1138197-Pelagomonas_calceolata.AAC.5